MILSNKSIIGLTALAVIGLAGVQPASAAVVYSNDFTTNANGFSNTTRAISPSGENFLGEFAADSPGAVPFNGSGLITDTLTLNGLAPHTTATVSFDFYSLKSTDGDSFGPDGFSLSAGPTGTETALISTTMANWNGSVQSFGGPDGLGGYLVSPGTYSSRTGASAVDTLGYSFVGDSTYHFVFTFADISPTLKLDWGFFTNQGVSDESGGLDNVVVSTNGSRSVVPEPSQTAVIGMGLAGLFGMMFAARKRKASGGIA